MNLVNMKRRYLIDRTEATVLLPDGQVIHTLEPPWLNNRSNVSCYPPGVYLCKYIERSASGKYKRCWHVQDVPGRFGILWHAGNLVRHTMGCILPGMKFGILEGEPAILSSLTGLNKMREVIGPEDFILRVR